MDIKITIKANRLTISKLAEEAETNDSSFIKKLCTDILQKIAVETKSLSEAAKEINLENPYGFPAI